MSNNPNNSQYLQPWQLRQQEEGYRSQQSQTPPQPQPQPQYYQQPPQYYQPIVQQQAPVQNVTVNVNTAPSEPRGESRFDGGLGSWIGLCITNFLLVLFTAGICFPWAVCRTYKWQQHHTIIDGRRLTFDGRAIQLFGKWILWWFLCIITLGIYAFWMNIALQKWITKHTHFE